MYTTITIMMIIEKNKIMILLAIIDNIGDKKRDEAGNNDEK